MNVDMYTLVNVAMRNWQSNLSTIPPWPGIVSLKSFTLNARLNPLAKKPPKGPTIELNDDNANECNTNG